MRRILLASCLSGAIALGGCSSFTQTTGITPQSTADFIAEVQQLSVAACGFLPAATTIAQIASAASASATAGVVLGTSIASAICAGVKAVPASSTTAKASRGGPTVYGVRIRGHFVR